MSVSWQNNDGLGLKFGVTEAELAKAGEFRHVGDVRITEAIINLSDYTFSTVNILDDMAIFPKNSRIEEVELVTEVAATGATATLDIGLSRTDRTTELDYDGFVKAATVASIAAVGTKIVYRIGVTGVGDLVGTTVANPGLITVRVNTANFTAGRVRCRVRWYPL